MNYQNKYIKYKTKYLNANHIGGGVKIQFILFGDVMTGHKVWFHDKNNIKIDFIDKLEKLGDVIVLKPNYVNFMNYAKDQKIYGQIYRSGMKNSDFSIEDLQFENYAKWVYNQIDPNKKYIAIGLDQGCHFAKYFCNTYPDNCICLYVLIDRNFTKDSYEKTFHSNTNYDYIKSIVGDNYEKYIVENLTNSTIIDLLNKIKKSNDDRYALLLNGICKGIIRSQYNKITKMEVKTIVYSDFSVTTPEKAKENQNFNAKSNDKIIYYYIIKDDDYLIHGKYKDDICNSIFGLVNNLFSFK